MVANERELVNQLFRTSQGDQAAFAELYAATAARLYSVCWHILGRRDAAEEALQEAYIRIWHQAERYSPARGGVLSWMISIARYRAIDQIRRDGRRPDVDSDTATAAPVADDAPGPGEATALHHDAEALEHCMKRLSDAQRQAIELAFLQGLNHQEVSARLDRPLGSVKSWIRRGLQALKRCLQT